MIIGEIAKKQCQLANSLRPKTKEATDLVASPGAILLALTPQNEAAFPRQLDDLGVARLPNDGIRSRRIYKSAEAGGLYTG